MILNLERGSLAEGYEIPVIIKWGGDVLHGSKWVGMWGCAAWYKVDIDLHVGRTVITSSVVVSCPYLTVG